MNRSLHKEERTQQGRARGRLVGFVHDSCETKVGHGLKDFRKAQRLLESWEHFNLGWSYTNRPQICVGNPVVVVAKSLGLWTINPLKITSTERSSRKMSFCHRTLRGHQLSGEECFSLEMRGNRDVWYGIDTVSKPASLIATLTYPLVRFYQNKFTHDSMERMKDKMKQ